jgi:muconolactone D-isomerase
MNFLLNIIVRMQDVDASTKDALMEQEHITAREHMANGQLRQIWRTPAQSGNWSIWDVDSATELHEIVSRLPLYRWMTVTVHPLAAHPLMPHVREAGLSGSNT